MIEFIISLIVALLIGAFYQWKVGEYYYGGIVLVIFCLVIPDIPKFFLRSGFMVNIAWWYLSLAFLFVIIDEFFSAKKSYLASFLFIEIALVSHLTIDYFFSTI